MRLNLTAHGVQSALYSRLDLVTRVVKSLHRHLFGCKSPQTSDFSYRMPNLDSADSLISLRQELKSRQLDAFLLPMEDNHFNEYIADTDRRIAFISGFTGSSGTVVITATDKAALWTDGRYHEQAAKELKENWILMREGLPEVPTIHSWLMDVTPANGRIGFDPQQVPFSMIKNLQKNAEVASIHPEVCRSFVPIEGANPVDLIWKDRPPRPSNPIRAVPVDTFAGYTWEEKVDFVRGKMSKEKARALVLFQLDEIAWLFNLRGSDIKYNPVFFSYAFITMDEIHLFIDWQRGPDSLDFSKHFLSQSHPVSLHPYDDFVPWIRKVGSAWTTGGVLLPATTSFTIASAFSQKACSFGISPVSSLKAVKNPMEVAGMRLANLVDSLALCDFLAWLEDVVLNGRMDPTAVTPCDGLDPPQNATEASLATYLDQLRLRADGCLGLSFATIPGADANGSVIHYHVNENSQGALLTNESVFLLDSGGQYLTGTTDVTRTVHLGTPTTEQISDYTEVLKAHAFLASLIFPENTPGTRLDSVCRAMMWRGGRDFAHGTGHGVGANLCVHEGPIRLSGRRLQSFNDLNIQEPGLVKHMVVTIEPGYYVQGKHGIRLENVVLTVEAPAERVKASAATPSFLGFEALTLVPFQRRMVDRSALAEAGPAVTDWVDAYHAEVRCRLLERIDAEARDGKLSAARQRTRRWILRETEPLS